MLKVAPVLTLGFRCLGLLLSGVLGSVARFPSVG